MKVLIAGTGKLAKALSVALVTMLEDCALTIVGRDAIASHALKTTAELHARAFGQRARVDAVQAELLEVDQAVAILDSIRPDVVVCCATTQSPWEGLTSNTRWTHLLAQTGIVGCLPLHLEIARVLATAALSRSSMMINAAFPDVVNPVLHALGVPVLAGLGNSQTVNLALVTALGIDESRVALLAHHLHLGPVGAADEALAWVDEQPVVDVGDQLSSQRRLPRSWVNDLTGTGSARLIQALTVGPALHTSLPGVLGLPGGYPVVVQPSSIQLRPVPGMTTQQCAKQNLWWCQREGVDLGDLSQSDGRVLFLPAVADVLRPHFEDLADGFALADLNQVIARYKTIRTRLRSEPPMEALR